MTPKGQAAAARVVLFIRMQTLSPNSDAALLKGVATLPDPEAAYVEAAAQSSVYAKGVGSHVVVGLQDSFTNRDDALAASRAMVRGKHVVPGGPVTATELEYLESLAQSSVETRGVGDYVVKGLRNNFPHSRARRGRRAHDVPDQACSSLADRGGRRAWGLRLIGNHYPLAYAPRTPARGRGCG